MNHAKLAAASVALMLLSPLAHAQVQMTPHETELYEAAKAEGSVTWYVSQFTTERADGLCQRFTERYPGVACNPVRASGQVVFQRLQQELAADALQADVMSTNDDSQMLQLKQEGHLEQYAPENLKHMIPALRDLGDKENYWITSGVAPIIMVYNTNLVSKEEAPKNWTDLYDPKWKGQVAIGHPGFSGSVGLWAILMNDLYGPEFFSKLEENEPQIGRSVADGHNLVVSGERKIALAPLPLVESDARQKGAPIASILPTDGALLPPSAAAMLKKAPHPNAAKLFLEFSLGVEASQYFAQDFRYPLRTDVQATEGMPPLDSYKTVGVPTEEAVKKLPDIQALFRDTFGI